MKLHLKDFVSLGSAAAAAVSIFLVIEGQVSWGCFFVWVAWLFDALDGVVARLTGKKNKIGAHLDASVDLLGCALAPAVCVYGGYQPILGPYWAAVIAAPTVLFGVLRQARNYANPPEVINQWVGLPRSYSGMGVAGLVGSHLFAYPLLVYLGIAYIVVMPALGITAIGWQGRHHDRLKWHQVMFMLMTFATFLFGLVMLVLGRGLAFFHDGMCFWMTMYTVFACWAAIPKEEKRQYRQYIRDWKQGF